MPRRSQSLERPFFICGCGVVWTPCLAAPRVFQLSSSVLPEPSSSVCSDPSPGARLGCGRWPN
eukprot:1923270-Lingulodinium_polyedra.AAC.1